MTRSSARKALLLLSFSLAPSLSAQTVSPASTRISAESSTFLSKTPWKSQIVATVFWVGELPTKKNPTPNTASSWDRSWMTNFGGFDDPAPEKRAADFRPVSFVPKQNPFYVALPYNDCVDHQTTKSEASKVIPWFKKAFKREGRSVCRDRWIAIRHSGRICYAQWSDCGPFNTTDASYVFGDARPSNSKNNGAGIDLAPAVRDYLGFKSGRTCDWRFVDVEDVPDGPWKLYGSNNHFAKDGGGTHEPGILKWTIVSSIGTRVDNLVRESVASKSPSSKGDKQMTPTYAHNQLAGDSRLEELRRQRDLWLRTSSTTTGVSSWSR